MKITTISNIDCLLTEKECMLILKISDSRTFRSLGISPIQISERITRYEPETIKEFIKKKKVIISKH